MASKHGNKVAVVWFRQDLRVADNPALRAAAAEGRRVLPVYVLDEPAAGAWPMGGAHRWWLHHSLTRLAADLAADSGGMSPGVPGNARPPFRGDVARDSDLMSLTVPI